MTSQLIAHAGARVVSLEELEHVEAPPSTDTWFPIRHSQVLHSAIETLGEAGFQVQRNQLALSRNDARFFATLDLAAVIAPGVQLAVGLRNSCDKSLPVAFCAGTRVTVCGRSERGCYRREQRSFGLWTTTSSSGLLSNDRRSAIWHGTRRF